MVSEDQPINPHPEEVGNLAVRTLRDVQWGDLDYLVVDMMQKILIFDLSEVLIMGLMGIKTTIAARLGVPTDTVGPTLGGEPRVDLCKGLISERTYWEQVLARQVGPFSGQSPGLCEKRLWRNSTGDAGIGPSAARVTSTGPAVGSRGRMDGAH